MPWYATVIIIGLVMVWSAILGYLATRGTESCDCGSDEPLWKCTTREPVEKEGEVQ